MAHKVLVIAPKSDLPMVDKEVVAVVNALGARLLQGVVVWDAVTTKLQEGWDIVWFATHGEEGGIMLSDGLINASQLTQSVRVSGAQLVFLNSCSGFQVAAAIHSELRTHMVAALKEVPDIDAYQTAKFFAFELSRGKSFPDAFNAALPGRNDNYVYFPGAQQASVASARHPSRQEQESSNEGMVAVDDRRRHSKLVSDDFVLSDISQKINRLVSLIDGDTSLGLDGMRPTLVRMQDAVRNLERTLAMMRIFLWFLGGTTAIAIIGLFALYYTGR